jgi:hypothetical protein
MKHKVGFEACVLGKHAKGFKITFENGYTISVQFGFGNYCDNHSDIQLATALCAGGHPEAINCNSSDAECAVLDPSGEFHQFEDWEEVVKGYISPAEVLELMNRVAKL